MSEKKVSRNTGIVYATKVIDALLQLMIFDISLMLILIGFFGRTDIGAVRCTAAVGLPAALLYIVRGVYCHRGCHDNIFDKHNARKQEPHE